ncbi:class B sortase [Clostridium massiliamazoniense]|uniref:class B sortase n=1 Tax=Clostridium massiliamazoniense TaxID=1347366 RepID=UPI0006D7FD2E|nr:class B sortase [Clostridium massiliamazoniense]
MRDRKVRMMKDSRNKIIKIILCVFVAVSILIAGYFFYQYSLTQKRNSELTSKRSNKYITNQSIKNQDDPSVITKISHDITGKLDKLQWNTGNIGVWHLNKTMPTYETIKAEYDNAHKINKDVIGWIWIEGTNINYPVEHNPNSDTYYLHHNWRNQKWWNGAIFLDKSIPSLNEHTLLIHGHDMLNSLMFAELMNFRNKEFFNQHNKIVLFDGENNQEEVFNPIGCFYAEPSQKFEFNIPQDQQEKYYKYMESKSIYPVEPVTSNKFLFLNSCLSNGTHEHLIVMSQEIKHIS